MSGINKILFFIESPFCKRDYDRFGVDLLRENGFEVEVWDFTPFLRPEVYQKVKVIDPVNYSKHYLFFDKHKALAAISQLKNHCIVICILGYSFNSYAVFRALSRNKIRYCMILANALPIDENLHTSEIVKFFDKAKKITFKKCIQFLFYRIPCQYVGVRPADFALAGGVRSVITNVRPINFEAETKILWLHTLDYDLFLKEKQNPLQVDDTMGVFLDEYSPFHPDYLYMGVLPFTSSEEYYPVLCDFFDEIEKRYGFRILIAAHPRSQYENHPEYFGGRSVIRGKTVELIKKSRFVIAHNSTAINFAVLFKKPVIFITTNKVKHNVKGASINKFAMWLGKCPINISKSFPINFEEVFKVNQEAYRNYKNSYIKREGTEELPFWQIFANHISQL